MKTLLALVLAWQSVMLLAQTSGVNPDPQDATRQISAPTIIERGPHHRTWERVEQVPGPEGKMIEQRRSYQELATGLHFKNERGEWEESQEQIEILPNNAGAAAMKGQHKVIFPPEIKSGLIELQTPDQKWMRSRVWGLAYFDVSTGESVLLAEVKESDGQLVGENMVNYPDAFTDLRADVRYTYTRAKFEQDVVLREEPPAPDQFGLNPETTRLQVLTEFVEAPQPAKASKQIGGLTDETLDFGALSIGAGKAFEATNPKKFGKHVPVAKEWGSIEGRVFLIEGASYQKIVEAMRKLPAGPQYKGAMLERRGKGVNTLVGLKKFLPKQYAKTSPAPTTSNKRMAKVTPRIEAGFVMDYVTLNATYTNYVFQGDTTYYISGATLLKSNTVVEGGTVIKFNSTGDGSLELIDGTIDCQTAAYRPAVFTSMNDNSVGETIAGSTGSPSVIYSSYIVGFGSAPSLELSHVRMSYVNCGVFLVGMDLRLSHSQFSHCDYPVYCNGTAVVIKNVLMHDVAGAAITAYASTLDVEHLTVDQCSILLDGIVSTSAFTNCLFVSVASTIEAFTSVNNATNASSAAVFQKVGGGEHYMVSGSAYRNVGTTNIDATLLASLRTKTTYPPIAYTNVTFTAPTTFNPQAQRDTDIPDLGYHYEPLDYSLGGCTANSNLTFTAGTAVGWFRTTSGWTHAGQAIRMTGNTVVSFTGTATSPTYFVRLNTVQENDRTAGYGHAGIENWESTSAPTVRGLFLRCSAQAGESFNGYFSDDYGGITAEMTHSEFWGGNLATYGDFMYYTNCLFRRLIVGAMAGGVGSEFAMRNCTMIGGTLWMYPSGALPVLVRDSAFDGTTIDLHPLWAYDEENDVEYEEWGYYQIDYNAYTNASNPFPIGGANDVASVVFDWQEGALGSFYQPWGSALTDEGSVAADAIGLYHFTTMPYGLYYKETTSQVDIGYHYVEVDGNGRPLDTDGDGLPDYLEDANGNGTVESGETDWASATDYGLRVIITEPKRMANLP